MKWIGQHIVDFIARFRSDVYLENIADGTVDSDKFLGLDSNNKIVKEAVSASTVTVTDSTANTSFPVVFHDGSNALLDDTGAGGLHYNPSNGNLAVPGNLTAVDGVVSIESHGTLDAQVKSTGHLNFVIDSDSDETGQSFAFFANALHGSNKIMSLAEDATLQVGDRFASGTVNIHNGVDDANSGELKFQTQRGAIVADAQDGDSMGKISFHGHDDGTPSAQQYGEISCSANDVTDGAEEGKIAISVASHDGELQPGLQMISGDAEDEVDVTIGNGATSTTTIAGTLTMGSTAAITNAGLLSVANQSNVTGVGTISSGTWQGTAIASAYLDADTAHLSGTQTFSGDKTFSGKCTIDSRVFNLPGTTDGDHTAGDVVYFGGTTSMTAGKCYYYTAGGVWALSNGGADATATGLLAIALGAASDTDGMLLRGMVTPYGPAGSDDEGKKVYLRVQDGTITTAIPTDSGNFVRIVGYMLHASNDAIYFCPDNSYVEVA